MIIGNPDTIAIELGEVDFSLDPGRVFIQLRFILFGQAIGDLEEKIPLSIATENMKTFLSCSSFRKDNALKDIDSECFFAKTFNAFFEYDYNTQPVLDPNLRDRHHLSDVGGDSICDKYGIAVADVSPGTSRIVVKDLRNKSLILDRHLESNEIDEIGRSFLEWGEQQRLHLKNRT